ncbi:MAG TPA: LLM class F420-dependent oxidoreductase [Ktedonosporobacter sp.]|nr:LLM class F420-dependent oxidoreductase [Ktedonosporobacter sp.]
MMKFGLFAVNMYACSYPETAIQVAQLAEEAGFESLWAGEHVVLPDPQVPRSPMAPHDRILDPIVALTYLAAHTSRVRLGTGIIILPQRNPLVLAKELASLDELSGGRLICGIGVGYLEPEFRALGIPFPDRGARTDDYLAAMRAIWTQPSPAYHGRFISFEGVQAHPQRNIPLVVGGESPAAYRRAVESATGWYGFNLDPNATAQALADIRKAIQHSARPQELGDLEISVTPAEPLTLEDVKRFADMGVHRLIVMPLHRMPIHSRDGSAIKDYVTKVGDTFIGRI